MLLNLLNLYSLIFALFAKIGDKTKELQEGMNQTNTMNSEALTYLQPTPLYLISEYMGELINIKPPDIPELITATMQSIHNVDITTTIQENATRCYEILVNCTTSDVFNKTLISSLLLLGLSNNLSNFSNFQNGFLYNDSDAVSFADLNSDNSNADYFILNATVNAFNPNGSDDYSIDGISNNKTDIQADKDVMSTTEDGISPKSIQTTTEDIYDNYDELYSDEVGDENRQKRELYESFIDTFSNYTNANNISDINNITLNHIYNILENITNTNSFWNLTNMSLEEFSIKMVDELINSLPNEEEEKCYETICETNNESTEYATENPTTERDSIFEDQISTTDSSVDTLTTEYDFAVTSEAYNHTANDSFESTADSITTPSITIPNIVEVVKKPPEKKSRTCEFEPDVQQMCWETMFGQELVKLTIMDMVRYSLKE